MRVHRISLSLAISIGCGIAAGPAFSQEYRGTFEQQMACTPDVFRLCSEHMPDASRIAKAIHTDGTMLVAPPEIGHLNDPIIAGLVAAYEDGRMSGTRIYDVAGRTYVGRVVEIPPRYGRDQLLAIMVPIDEIEKPITEIRNQTLFYSIGFLVFALPLYVTLVVAWIDRRLEARAQTRDDD